MLSEMATIDTGVPFSDPATDPRTWEDTSISPNVKNPANDVYVRIRMTDDSNLYVYGVRIWYHPGF